MAGRELDMWLEKFTREIAIKSTVILYGNTNDIIYNSASHKFEPIINTIISKVREKGYEKVIKWDRIDGIDNEFDQLPYEAEDISVAGGDLYDTGMVVDSDISADGNPNKRYEDPKQFFPYMLSCIRTNKGKNAFIVDYSDYIFGNANALSEQERGNLASLGKCLAHSKSYNLMDSSIINDIGNIVVFISHDNATIPPSFYLKNPMVSSVNVSMPGRNERANFFEINSVFFKLSRNLNDASNKAFKDDFIDSMEGLSLREMVQIMKLSNQVNDDGRALSVEKLINLYKYGEKVSPWEELSKEKLEEIEDRLKARVKGQDDAVKKVKDVIIRAYTGFSGLQHSSKQKKPKGTLFFVGPTGVGKTELAKSLAEFIFGDENACIRFDMSEFNHEHSDQRLVGAPPGYVGYEAGGQLTNAVKAKPFCVLLFDEIEKAHGKILDKFLQILEDGRLTDGKGETVYFSETIIIFTSNIGAANISSDGDTKEIQKQFLEAVQKHFVENLGRPELLNRIGNNIVAFNFINDMGIFSKIAELKFKNIQNFVKERYHANLEFEDQEAAFEAIANKSGVEQGGRGLLNVMETYVINPLSEFIFENMDGLVHRNIIIKQVRPSRPVFAFEVK